MATDSTARPESVLQGWQPIETAPKDGTDLLIFDPRMPVCTAYWSDSVWASVNNPTRGQGGGWVQEVHRSDTFVYSPTHWMPLPPAPTMGGA